MKEFSINHHAFPIENKVPQGDHILNDRILFFTEKFQLTKAERVIKLDHYLPTPSETSVQPKIMNSC
jgi:hypothetical protein